MSDLGPLGPFVYFIDLWFNLLFEDEVVESDEVLYKDESDTCLFLMNHLVSKLSACDDWKMDIDTRRDRSLICPCSVLDCPRKQPVDDDFQDLSIGKKQKIYERRHVISNNVAF